MKTMSFHKKLTLNKETVANLNQKEMNGLYAGIGIIKTDPVPVKTLLPDPCTTLNVYQCLTDPPTMCYTCPMPETVETVATVAR
jgi:hypothetical protein